MNTASKASSKLLISEAKILDSFDIISPLVETSSSTATIESTTAQISSKSSSPFHAITFKDSPKLSPLSESTISPSHLSAAATASCATGGGSGSNSTGTISGGESSKPKALLKSPISPDGGPKSIENSSSNSTNSLVLPFLSETYRKINSKQSCDSTGRGSDENMLSSTSCSTTNQQAAGASATTSAPLLSTTAASPTDSIKNIKCEPFSTLSPLNESASQSMLDETSNNNNGNNNSTNSNNASVESVLKRERESSTSSTSMMRQNSNGSINSCTTVNASSPNNGSDHSNSSNISSNVSQSIDNNGVSDIVQDVNEKNLNKKGKGNGANSIKEEDAGLPTSDKSSTASTSKNSICTTRTLNPLSSVKEEPEVMNIMNVKKEESNISPDMSPVGFGSIPNLSGGSSIGGARRAGTPVRLDDVSNNVSINNNSSNVNNNEKLAAVLSSMANSNGPGGADESISGGASVPILNTTTESCSIGNVQHSNANTLNNNNTGAPLSNCMEYMQQQNHIFVFSTQLANKGAESVINGQFPTIIAYHCTQPATKNFLEDFLMKNPMKVSKLQRQNSLNLCNISVGTAGQPWVGGGSCNTIPKMSQKSNGNKMNFSNFNASLDNKLGLRPPNLTSFGETPDTIGNDADIMCWEQTRSGLEGSSTEPHIGLKMSNGVDPVVGGHVGSHVTSKQLGSSDGGSTGNDVNTPSLQGIKVPDENLTPQQRQHREEQLAKLKQIDQFLSNPLQGASPLSKLSNDGVPSNLAGIMLSLPGAGPSGISPQMGNQINPSLRNMPPNVINQNNQGICNPENMPTMPTSLGDGGMVPSDIMSAHEMANLTCNTDKGPCNTSLSMNNQPNLPCGPGNIIGPGAPNVNVGNMPGNVLSCHGGASNMNGSVGLMPNSPEVLANFNQTCGSQDINQVGIAQMEWSKLQHQFYEERIKGNKTGPTDIGCMPSTLCRSNSSGMANVNMRPNLTGACVPTSTTASNQTIRASQGPPPPYHPTQRSASVPIATQSPNPTSPNNPTSNLSLPSPRTSGTMGIAGNSPNMDGHSSSSTTAAISSATTTTSSANASTSNGSAQAKNNFHPEGSPTSGANNNCGNNRSRNGQINQFNSNPSTPLSHLSPKDLESFHANVPAGDLKSARPSPQRSRTPIITPNNGGSVPETGNIEGRFPPGSPGLSFPSHIQAGSAGNPNNYKGPGALERQTSAPVQAQFCRRTDNLPLNPNSNRPPQNKLSHSFDPISSLAQMSQQLTSCVPLNASGVGTSTGGMSVIGVNDINVPNNMNQNQMDMMSSMDSSMEHCNSGVSGIMGMPPHMNGPAPYLSNNCHINSMLGPMGQRLLNPKMCGGFNPAAGGMREGPANVHGVMPTHRMMGRMTMSFGNFNVSPNIQVKASTPNTIQYMPVRPQNSNNSSMRLPPSLEFLRYANPQMAGAGNIMDNSHLGQGNPSGPNHDPNKMGSCNNGSGGANTSLNFFGNCHQIVGEQDDLPGNMLSGHDMNMGAHGPIIRGMRPIRQHNLGHGGNQMVAASRMQAPPGAPTNMNSGGSMMPAHFGGAPQEAMECGGDGPIFGVGGNAPGPGPNGPGQPHLYTAGGHQKPGKQLGGPGSGTVGSGICQNINPTNVGNNGQMANSGGVLSSDHNTGMSSPANGPLLMGTGSNLISNAISGGSNVSPVSCGGNGGPGNGGGPGGGPGVGVVGGNGTGPGVGNYKPFVGPTSNDLKYAQQYHSFQQQLYATSTRSQQNSGNANISNNVAGNPTFFVNK